MESGFFLASRLDGAAVPIAFLVLIFRDWNWPIISPLYKDTRGPQFKEVAMEQGVCFCAFKCAIAIQ